MEKNIVFSLGFALLASLLIIALNFILWSCQQSSVKEKKYLIGVINPNKETQDINRGFMQQLEEYGFVEGKNTSYIEYDSNFEIDQIIQDMVARDADLIFTVTTPATSIAQKSALDKNIPVVFVMQDPVESGIISSLAQPGSNITGIQIRGSVPKTVEWMLSIAPGINHLFVPIKYDTKAAEQSLEDLRTTAATLEIKLTLAEVNDQLELDKALSAIPEDANGIFILCSIFIQNNVEKLVKVAKEKKLFIASGSAQSERGVTLSYGMVAHKAGSQAGRLANLILQGINPSEIPSEICEFFFGVNLQTAEETDIVIPTEILQQADIIIRG